jgi:uncharacterized protein YidB (DUF937 family)
MGVLEGLAKEVAAGTGGGDSHTAMASAVLGMLTKQGAGGLQALVQSFQGQGLEEVVSSWVGPGANRPVSPDQVYSALGADNVQQLARQAGVSSAMAKTLLAAVLPVLIDKMTPGGAMPSEQSLLGGGLGLLAKKFL